MTRAVIYARYSSHNQRDASIEDQIRQCKAHVEHQGWRLTNTYTDRAISGASPLSSPLKKASLTGFHTTAKHIAAKAVSPSSETMRTI